MLTAEEEKLQLENSSPKAKKAMELFQEGYNCAQAVLGAFAQDMNMDFQQAMMLSSSFGGGMGRMREVCGAVSAMFMVAGLEKGYSDPKASTEKAGHYDYIQQLAAKFKEENGSIICRDLLGLTKPGPDTPVPEPRTEAYYKKRPCQLLVGQCAAILEQELNQ
ncbi:MAG: C_GCAxxG_C_C family protein [Treponema sp.]|nr:C_GCAxxG_C_C family protein [Treponema sp.]